MFIHSEAILPRCYNFSPNFLNQEHYKKHIKSNYKIRNPWKYCIFRPITRALSIKKGSEIVKNEHAWYTLERFQTDNAKVICTKKGIGKYGIMY